MQIILFILSSLVLSCWSEPYTKSKNSSQESRERDTKETDEIVESNRKSKNQKRTSDQQKHEFGEDTSHTFKQKNLNFKKIDTNKFSILEEKEIGDLKNHTEQELRKNEEFSKVVIDTVNELKTEPKKFKKHVIALKERFIKNQASDKSYYIVNTPTYKLTMQTHEGLPAIEEAIKFLDKMPENALKPGTLKYNPVLLNSSLLHAKCMRKEQFFGHYNEKSKSLYNPWDRVKKYCKSYEMCAENLWLGSVHDNPTLRELAVILIVALFVDDGVPDRGHRHALVNGDATDLGVAIFPYYRENDPIDQRKHVFVMNFGAGITV